MKIWDKIEIFLNAFLTTFASKIFSLLKKSTPKKISKKYTDTQEQLKNKKLKIKELTQSKKNQAISKVLNIKEKSFTIKENALAKSQTLAKNAKEFDPKKFNYKKISLVMVAVVAPFFIKIKTWFITLQPATLVVGITTTTIIGLSAINFYSQVEKISEKRVAQRGPASVDKKRLGTRAVYYKQTEREIKMTNIEMPVYVGESKKLKSVTMDFTIVSSNRYIPNFFFTKPYYIRDKLNSTLHPFIPELPLETEGKIILKVKIKDEINNLLKELKIKGEINEIHIHSLLAG